MGNKALLIICLLALSGCRSKKALYEKELAGAEVEKIVQVEKKVQEVKKSDTIKEKKESKKEEETETNLHVEFNPKKNDSLKVSHVFGGDTLNLNIQGNGMVRLDFKTKKKQVTETVKEIFGSETLYNIDSTIKKVNKEKTKSEVVKKAKDVRVQGTTFPVYLVAGLLLLTLAVGLVFWFYGKDILNRLNFKR